MKRRKYMTKKEATQWTGGLSNSSKMPQNCTTWGISAFDCLKGSVLTKEQGTVCSICYARKNRFLMPNVQRAYTERLHKWKDAWAEGLGNRDRWVRAMVTLIDKDYHRWFDSGDLQSLIMLIDIMRVIAETPHTRHWLPTQEIQFVTQYLEDTKDMHIPVPKNVTLRFTHPQIDGFVPNGNHTTYLYGPVNKKLRDLLTYHEVDWGMSYAGSPDYIEELESHSLLNRSRVCEAALRQHKCGPCRKCWDNLPIIYPSH